MTINVNVVNLFKSKAAKTFNKSKVRRDAHADEYCPSVDARFCSGKKILKFGTTTTVVDMDHNLSKAEPLEYVKPVQSSSLPNPCADIHAEKQNKILSKVKSAKNKITKLFKPTGHDSANAPCVEPFATLGTENLDTIDHSLSLPPILQRAKPEAPVVAAYESILTLPSLEAIASPITYGENVADERTKDLAATSCCMVKALLPPSIKEHFATPEFPSDARSSTFLLSEPHAIKEEDERSEMVVTKEQGNLVPFASPVRSISNSEVTVCFSSNTLSARTTASEAGLIGSEISASLIATSFATSVDAEYSYQFLPGAPHGLRRVPNYEDLRIQIIAGHDFSCSDLFLGSSDCDISNGAASSIHAAPLRRPMKCDNLRKSFLSFERKVSTPSTSRISKFRMLRAWLSARCHESSHDAQRTSASRASSEPQRVTSASRSRQFLQGILRPSSCVQAHFSTLSSRQSLLQSMPPIWSCAKITRSGPKAKRRRRMTKQSTRELKARLDSMDINPWY